MKRNGISSLAVVLAAASWMACLSPSALAQGTSFKRGDTNASDKVDLSDAVFTLGYLFSGGPAPGCLDSADTNDDGKLDISDPVSLLNFLFSGGIAPRAPFPDCGADPTADGVSCVEYPRCVACFDQSALEAAITAKVDPIVCIPAGSVDPLPVGTLEATVCPVELAKPCPTPGSATQGCPVELTSIEGALDVVGSEVTLHVQGKVVDLPIRITDTGSGTNTDCKIDIVFEGDVVLPFTTAPAGGLTRTITDLLAPELEGAVVTLSTDDTALLCKGLVALQDLFIDEVILQLQAASAELTAGLKEEIVGKTVCLVAP